MAKALADYPRPKNDTGLGMHLSADVYNARFRDAGKRAHDVDLWNQMGVRWLKSLTDGDSQLVAVGALVQAGLEVIVRFYKPPLTTDIPPADLMKKFADVGIHYAESYINEPEIEWGRPPTPDVIDMLADAHIRFADTCAQVGLIPVTPAIQSDRVYRWFKPMLERIIARGRKDVIEGSVIGGHWRPGRMPVDSPAIDQTRGGPGFVFRGYELFDDVVRELLGHSLPLLGTEAGREPPEVDNDIQRHAADNVALAQLPWRDSLFCQCYWLWSDGSTWSDSTWVDNRTYGARLPAVDRFIAMPKPVRGVKSEAGGVTPEPGGVKPEAVTEVPPAVALALRQTVQRRMAAYPWGVKEAWRRGFYPFGEEIQTTAGDTLWFGQPARRPNGSTCILVFRRNHYTPDETQEIEYAAPGASFALPKAAPGAKPAAAKRKPAAKPKSAKPRSRKQPSTEPVLEDSALVAED